MKINEVIRKYTLYVCSFMIFLFYLSYNFKVNYFDENGYIHVSRMILNEGLLSIAEPLRTYLFPLIISIFSIFSDGNILLIKILVSIFQFIVYCLTIRFIANHFSNIPIIRNSILVFGLLNPYLIQATTLFLTDLLATCAIAVAIFKAIYGDYSKRSSYFIVFISAFSAVMIRPSSLIMIPVVIIIMIVRKMLLKDISLSKSIIAGTIALLVFTPQLYNNVKQYNDWTPLIHQDLYEFQSTLAATYLKYGTVVIPDEQPALVFASPYAVDANSTIYDLLFNNFFVFVAVYVVHLFGVIDWGYIDTYINDWYPVSRLLGSIFLYVFWLLSFYGVYKTIREKKIIEEKFAVYSLIVSFLVYWAFIGTTVIESRFGYPLFLLVLPFSGVALHKLVNDFKSLKSANKKKFNRKIIIYSVVSLSFILIMFYLSFALDAQTGRINWL